MLLGALIFSMAVVANPAQTPAQKPGEVTVPVTGTDMIPPELPRFPIDIYELPPLGGQQEMLYGMKALPTQFFNYFAEYATTENQIGNARYTRPDSWQEQQVGYMSWSVSHYQHNGQPAYLLQTDSTYKQVLKISKYRQLNLKNRWKRSYWVTDSGKLLEDDSVLQLSNGNWVMSATFGKDSYDLYIKNPEGEQKKTINVPEGLASFDAMFQPMVKDGRLDYKKEFTQLDPITGAPIKFQLKSIGTWSGKDPVRDTPYKGTRINLDGGKVHEQIYVTDDGKLMRVNVGPTHYLGANDLPAPIK